MFLILDVELVGDIMHHLFVADMAHIKEDAKGVSEGVATEITDFPVDQIYVLTVIRVVALVFVAI